MTSVHRCHTNIHRNAFRVYGKTLKITAGTRTCDLANEMVRQELAHGRLILNNGGKWEVGFKIGDRWEAGLDIIYI